MCFVCESHASVSIAVCFYCHLMLLQFISKWNGIGLAYFTILSLETQIPIMSMHIDLLCDRCTFGTALKLTCFTAGLNNSDMASLWTLEKKTSQYCISNEWMNECTEWSKKKVYVYNCPLWYNVKSIVTQMTYFIISWNLFTFLNWNQLQLRIWKIILCKWLADQFTLRIYNNANGLSLTKFHSHCRCTWPIFEGGNNPKYVFSSKSTGVVWIPVTQNMYSRDSRIIPHTTWKYAIHEIHHW